MVAASIANVKRNEFAKVGQSSFLMLDAGMQEQSQWLVAESPNIQHLHYIRKRHLTQDEHD